MMQNQLLQKLRESVSNFDKNQRETIEAAFAFAREKHKGVKRKTGEDYINHPLRIALNLATDGFDASTIAAGLLHDTVEDTDATQEDIIREFGPEIEYLVDGVTKVSSIKLTNKNRIFDNSNLFLAQVDNYRKILFATSSDIRVVILKLYDRLDNIQTIRGLNPAKKKFYARETIEIFAPIAERLGMGFLKGRLEDAAFPYAYPEEYKEFKKLIPGLYENADSVIKKTIPEIKRILIESNIEFLRIEGRSKFHYSLWRKIQRKGGLGNIFDISALRIIVHTIPDCYKSLGLIHSIYEPLPSKIKDYIAKPKDNGYQSLHTTVKNKEGEIFEVQIRTEKMHEISEHGVASHWNFKENSRNNTLREDALIWVSELEKLKKISDKKEFITELKDQFFSEQIFTFTPRGDIIKIRKDATPIDFAYRIHTGLGHRCIGAKINNRIMPLSTKLNTGDVVEIITSKSFNPSKDWLEFVVTSDAKQKIRSFIKQKDSDTIVELGLKKIKKYLDRYSLEIDEADAQKKIDRSTLPYKSLEKAAIAIYENNLGITKLIKILFPNFKNSNKQEAEKIKTIEANLQKKLPKLKGIRHQIANCCKPKLKDNIVGYLGREHIIKVHKRNCEHLKTLNQDRIIEL